MGHYVKVRINAHPAPPVSKTRAICEGSFPDVDGRWHEVEVPVLVESGVPLVEGMAQALEAVAAELRRVG